MSAAGQDLQRYAAMLTPAFRRTMLGVHGDEGAAWLEALPALIAECAEQYGVEVIEPFALSYNFVARGKNRAGEGVVLKLGVPSELLTREMVGLQLYNGRGAARLLACDPARGVLLIEQVQPGAPLSQMEDDVAATEIAAGVMAELWPALPEQHPFPDVRRWSAALGRLRAMFGGGTGPLPERMVSMAERLYDELIASSGPPVLVHGDLHHYNILQAEREPWLVIDPHGVAGEREYEIGALLRNPFPVLPPPAELKRIEARRLDQLSELLGFDRQRLAAWGAAQAVLSAAWDVEDHTDGWPHGLAYAEALEQCIDG